MSITELNNAIKKTENEKGIKGMISKFVAEKIVDEIERVLKEIDLPEQVRKSIFVKIIDRIYKVNNDFFGCYDE